MHTACVFFLSILLLPQALPWEVPQVQPMEGLQAGRGPFEQPLFHPVLSAHPQFLHHEHCSLYPDLYPLFPCQSAPWLVRPIPSKPQHRAEKGSFSLLSSHNYTAH